MSQNVRAFLSVKKEKAGHVFLSSSFGTESPALRGRRAWDCGTEQCLGEWRLWGWAGSVQGWGGRQLQGLRGLVSLRLGCRGMPRHRGSLGAARNTESSLPVLGSGTGAQTSREIKCWGRAVMKCPSEASQRHPEKAGLWEGGCWGQKSWC